MTRLARGLPRILPILLIHAVSARAQQAGDLEALRREVADTRTRLESEQQRLVDLEARIATLEGAPAAPAAPATPAAASPSNGGPARLRLMDISLGGLFAAGASTATEDQIALLDAGGHDPHQQGITVQNVELSFLGAVDPYLKGESHVVLQIDKEGETSIELEEAYLTTQTLPHGLQVKAGQYFTDFGRLNATHPHTWAFANQPVINSRLLGGDGLRGPGARLSWLTPAPWYSELMFGVQNARGETASSFFGSADHDPVGGHPGLRRNVAAPSDMVWSARWLNSVTLTDHTTLNLGASGAFGPNGSGESSSTRLLGVDAFLKWKRKNDERGFPFVAWQSELMKRDYEAGAFTDAAGASFAAEKLHDWGLYSQVTWGFKPGWTIGFRVDHAEGDQSAALDSSLDPARDDRTRLTTALTWYPTEFSKLRFQYDFDRAQFLSGVPGASDDAHSLWIQWEFNLGAHGAHSF
jgi:hypothetical protein